MAKFASGPITLNTQDPDVQWQLDMFWDSQRPLEVTLQFMTDSMIQPWVISWEVFLRAILSQERQRSPFGCYALECDDFQFSIWIWDDEKDQVLAVDEDGLEENVLPFVAAVQIYQAEHGHVIQRNTYEQIDHFLQSLLEDTSKEEGN